MHYKIIRNRPKVNIQYKLKNLEVIDQYYLRYYIHGQGHKETIGHVVKCNICGLTKIFFDDLYYDSAMCGCAYYERVKKRCIKALYNKYKYNANKRNIDFDLTYDFFKKLIQSKCVNCNIEGGNTHIDRSSYYGFKYNGIDRIDNSKGYTKDNVVPCCKICNFMKGKLTEEEFLNKVHEINEFRKLGESNDVK